MRKLPDTSIKKSVIKRIIFAFLTLSLVIGTTYGLYSFFKINEILVISESISNSSDVLKITEDVNQSFKGRNIFMVDSKDIQSFISRNTGLYKVSDFIKTYPSKIEFKISLIDSKFLVKASNGVYSISGDFLVIEKLDDNANTHITYDYSLQLGQLITDNNLISGMRYSELQDSKVSVSTRVSLKVGNDVEVILPSGDDSDPEQVLNLLKKILQKYSIDNRELEIIDLRYSEPLIKFK